MNTAPHLAVKQARPLLLSIAFLALGACAVPVGQKVDKTTGFLTELPEGVAQIAAPYQNLQEVLLKPEDGCYWYRHTGPVETTMLPLRSVRGRPICINAEGKPAV
ncbi:MAG: hypothetical protein V4712_17200 [Pseudomonadota bacterium]